MADRYEIKTIADILENVPVDKIELFLADLKSFLEMANDMKSMFSLLEVEIPMSFIWIDDDKNNKELTFKFGPQGDI